MRHLLTSIHGLQVEFWNHFQTKHYNIVWIRELHVCLKNKAKNILFYIFCYISCLYSTTRHVHRDQPKYLPVLTVMVPDTLPSPITLNVFAYKV